MRLLLLGGTGQVGAEFRGLPVCKELTVVAPNRAAVDLADPRAIPRVIAAEAWSAVINAAAYTDVDRAESEEELAFAINAEAPSIIATETARHGIPLIHISTDYVFDGRKGTPYTEHDAVAPLNAYGRSKLAGEENVRNGNSRHVILRTSWVYSPYRRNFVRTILRLAAERDRLTVVADQFGCPTAARDIASACFEIALRCAARSREMHYGTYHFTGDGEASWFGFASTIVEMASNRIRRSPLVVPIRSVDYPTTAVRPTDSRLDCAAFSRDFGIERRPWRQSLEITIERLLAKDMA
jgi:dTDP-4-dehydrorhamnose reductase